MGAMMLLWGAFMPATVMAQDGSAAYNYLNITSSSRIYGLGGVNITAVEDELSVADQNPGLLGWEMDNQVLVDYMHYLGESNFAGIKYARAAGERGAWAAGIRYFGYGKMQTADETGVITGSFAPSDINFNGTFSYDITDRLRGGITLKFLYSSYESYSALAIAADLGINYYDPDNDISLSAVLANAGGQVKRFHESYNRVPIDLRLGIAKMFTGLPIRFSITAWNLFKWKLPYFDTGDGTSSDPFKTKENFTSNLFRHLVFGVDFIPSDRFYVALGYNYKTRTDMSTYSRSFLSGFSLGAGLNLRRFNLGLAFAQPHSGATTLMLNLNLNLNDIIY
ncbi:MAG: type IX secretion system protein PorQ [Muribaculaceae bacterium]|nr:type IX secretion system protein PorQ [Muribaculaceae bacterium]